MNLAEWLARSARRDPHAPALLRGQAMVATYGQFADRAARIGAALKTKYGVSKGDRVALYLANCTEYLEILYGAWFIGAVVVPINYKLHPREAVYIIGDSESSVGTAQSCVEVMVADESGQPVETGASGEILVRGASEPLRFCLRFRFARKWSHGWQDDWPADTPRTSSLRADQKSARTSVC